MNSKGGLRGYGVALEPTHVYYGVADVFLLKKCNYTSGLQQYHMVTNPDHVQYVHLVM